MGANFLKVAFGRREMLQGLRVEGERLSGLVLFVPPDKEGLGFRV